MHRAPAKPAKVARQDPQGLLKTSSCRAKARFRLSSLRKLHQTRVNRGTPFERPALDKNINHSQKLVPSGGGILFNPLLYVISSLFEFFQLGFTLLLLFRSFAQLSDMRKLTNLSRVCWICNFCASINSADSTA